MTLLVLVVCGLAAAPARATHVQDHIQVAVYAPPRVFSAVFTLATEDFEQTRPPARFRIGGHTRRVFWNNVLAGMTSTTEALGMARRSSLATGVYADRPLTGAERRRFREVAPLYDDADVLAVAAGHPACAGLSRAQARGIASGSITRWSQVVAGATSDTISVRFRGSRSDADLRFGARYVKRSGRFSVTYPASARGSADGGLGAAASGDQSVAAVGAWSRLRGARGVCLVPLGGVAPTAATVAGHSYPEFFRVTYVVPRKRIRDALVRKCDQIVHAFMRSAAAKAALARRGLLVVGGAPAGTTPVPVADGE